MSGTIALAGSTIETEPGITIEEAVRKAGYLPDAYLYVSDGRPIPMDTPMEDAMSVRAIKVASGG